MNIIEKKTDISLDELEYFLKQEYVSVDTETTGLNYRTDKLCTIQLFAGDLGIILKYSISTPYDNLKSLFLSNKVTKIFHNAVFDVSFLMNNLALERFGKLVCTKISSKIISGLDHNNSLKILLYKYLNVSIDKQEQMSDWSKDNLSKSQKMYAINDVRYLLPLWEKLRQELEDRGRCEIAYSCFGFIPTYKLMTDMEIDNIFKY